MTLLFTERAEVVTEYSERRVRGVEKSYTLPKILRLFGRHLSDRKVRFSRYNVFIRDAFSCQYCSIRLPQNLLTIDHVIPVSKGGKTNWENVVTSCSCCNTKKGNKSVREASMKLKTRPRRPNWSPQMCLRVKKNDPEEWYDWFGGSRKKPT